MSNSYKNTAELYSSSPDETQSLGNKIGRLSTPGDLILMTGELGAGKTCFTQGVLNGIGSPDHVRSPTFVLVMEYKARIPLYHADLYRISESAELDSIGIEDYFNSDGICVVEWADRFDYLYQLEHLAIQIDWDRSGPSSEKRRINLTSKGLRHSKLIDDVIDSNSRKIR
tara:strand:+ start:154 stop:663 length:510 start_codon:yes stop_codon:yes gene_type:complete